MFRSCEIFTWRGIRLRANSGYFGIALSHVPAQNADARRLPYAVSESGKMVTMVLRSRLLIIVSL